MLDALLEDGRLALEGVSGTSAGAVNAAALAGGYAQGVAGGADPRERARESLARIWGEISAWGTLGALQQRLAAMLRGGPLSPYQSNPLDINPLRDLLEREIDFEAIARLGVPKVFVSATHVNSGRATLFSGHRLTAQAVMASACLPVMFRAVEIDGECYWDGGYAPNPPLTPLINACAARDLMLVQINPLWREQVPRCKHVLLHRVDGGPEMARYPASSRSTADAAMIGRLFELGRARAQDWLARNFDAIGGRRWTSAATTSTAAKARSGPWPSRPPARSRWFAG